MMDLRRLIGLSEGQSQSDVMTNGQSASLSWYQATIWGSRAGFYYCQLQVC
jgi:hypothetical protein